MCGSLWGSKVRSTRNPIADSIFHSDGGRPSPSSDCICLHGSHFFSKEEDLKKTDYPKFVKKANVPYVLLPSAFERSTLAFSDQALIGQLKGMWPSLKSMVSWISKFWKPMMKGGLGLFACGKWFFAFLFELQEDKDLVFQSEPYFFGTMGIYLNKWTLEFDHDDDIPSVVPVWVKLPRFSLSC